MSHVDRSHLPDSPADVFWRDGKDTGRIAARLGPDRSSDATCGRSKRAARPDRRCRVWESEHLRRTDPDARTDSRVAGRGLRYNRFHVTALCSPTRAVVADRAQQPLGRFRLDRGVRRWVPGVLGDTATRLRAPLPRILRRQRLQHCNAVGKWHLTPDGQQGPAGPFDRWPNGWGFDYFYGILGGGASQWDPCLAENQKIIGTPDAFYDDERPLLLPRCDGGSSIEWLHGVRAQDAHKPFFFYFSTGCSHAPHHVAKAWADRYKGKFDQGWDKLREETFARQKELGVIPVMLSLRLATRAFPAWDDVPST